MSKLELWLIRHGQSSINAGVWTTSPANASLTDLGKEQAQSVVAEITIQPDLIITSSMQRSKESAYYVMQTWPTTPAEVWSIQEFIYLSPSKLAQVDAAEKKARINEYWRRGDPSYCDGSDAESFASFLRRVSQFHTQILKYQGFIIAVGHGQFFKAYQLGTTRGFKPTTEWMQHFRQQETSHPIHNSEIIKIVV